MPTKQDYKQALKIIPRDQRVAFLYLEALISEKARPVEVFKVDYAGMIKDRLDRHECRISDIEDLKKTLNKNIKDQRKYVDGKLKDNTAILDKLDQTVSEMVVFIKDLSQLRDKMIKEQSIDLS